MKRINYIKAFLTCLVFSLFVGCNEDVLVTEVVVNDPIVTSIDPQSGEVGTEVTIYGENLHIIKSVTVGGGEAPIKYRLSQTEMIVTVSTDTRSGNVIVTNNFDVAVEYTEQSFEVTFKTPTETSTDFPTASEEPVETSAATGHWGEVGQMIVVNGSYLTFVDEVYFGDTQATIITQRSNELIVEIPLLNFSEDVELKLTYYNGTADTYVSLGTFHVIVLVPTVTSDIPETLTKYTPITLTGYNMDLFNSFYVVSDDDELVYLTIKSQNSTTVELDINTNFFEASFEGTVYAIYNNDKTMEISDITLIADPNEPRYYTYTNIFMSGRSENGGGDLPFLDLETGVVKSVLGVTSDYAGVDIMIYDNSGYCQLYGAHNTSSTYKNYKYDGTALSSLIDDWASTVVGNTVKFRALDPTDEDHAALIAAYEAGTIVYLSVDDDGVAIDPLVAAISAPASSSPRVYQSYTTYNAGYISVDEYPYVLVQRTTPDIKYGIIKITSVGYAESNPTQLTDVTFDCIWSL